MKITDSSYGGGGCGGGSGGGGEGDNLFGDPRSWPPGFRFHPTDEELILYYLKRKICRRRLKFNVIKELDVYKWDPEELPGQSILQSRDRQYYFFTPRDRRYPNGARSNRATRQGYWKATGKDRLITLNSRNVGVKKTLVFYQGRAPAGDRTDWVMHEYTMDEGELQRCNNVQDYFALYKIFKKSGPGPKNGEQYGAPFVEEDWADDDEVVENNTTSKTIQVLNTRTDFVDNTQPKAPVEDLDELLRRLLEEEAPNTVMEPSLGKPKYIKPISCYAEEAQSTMVGESPKEAVTTELVLYNAHQSQFDVCNFTAAPSTASFLPPGEAPEVTSASNVFGWDSPGDEGISFLEIDDLEGPPQPGISNVVNVGADCTNFGDLGDLMGSESDAFFDANMFLQDMGSVDQSSFYYGDGQVWMHDERFNVSAPSGSNQVLLTPPTSATAGIIHGEKQDENENENDLDSWCTSAISAFLGSVPTRPALASENVLINRAFERMSSFGRVRIPVLDSATDNGAQNVVERRRRGVSRNGGVLFVSVLVVVSSVLWMVMIGTALKILKNIWGRFISS